LKNAPEIHTLIKGKERIMKKILSLFAALALAVILFSTVGTNTANARWNPCTAGPMGEYCYIVFDDDGNAIFASCLSSYSGICGYLE
jgi:hypothetical protein